MSMRKAKKIKQDNRRWAIRMCSDMKKSINAQILKMLLDGPQPKFYTSELGSHIMFSVAIK